MSPRLKPLLLPQLVEERRKVDVPGTSTSNGLASPYGAACDMLPYAYYTTNSSSSDITSPVTPTFSTRGHVRYSSSTSSLELPPQSQDSPSSPSQHAATLNTVKSGKRQLPDVEEEPMERDDDSTVTVDNFGLYSCLCDDQCTHRNSSDDIFPGGDFVSDCDYDFDYDIGFLSDSDFTADPRYPKKKRSTLESPFTGLTTRLGSRFPTIKRWRSSRRGNLPTSPPNELSMDNVLSRAPSSRSSSLSASHTNVAGRTNEPPMPPPNSSMSFYDDMEPINMSSSGDIVTLEARSSIERDRAMATTPLLPPLMTGPLSKPPQDSPLQSPTVEPSPAATQLPSPQPTSAHFPRPSLSTRPSFSSLHLAPTGMDLPLPLPAIMQEHDEWSDRLGHANFTITPLPYDVEILNVETIGKFRDDWDAARVNYTKHLVRTGENYGQTSKIYALTEAKWAETERRWKTVYDDMARQCSRSAPSSTSTSRSRSRGRGRGRSESASIGALSHPSADDAFAGMQWRHMEDCLPSAVPQMLEALDAQGKFPGRGDEDIVGPMQRDAYMARGQSEDRKGGRFWKSLVDKVGIRK